MTSSSGSEPLVLAVRQALRAVQDPEIHRPITDLGMVRSVELETDHQGKVTAVVGVDLTTQGCPLQDTITKDVTDAVERLEDRKSTRLNSSHVKISYAVFCLK